MILEWRVVIKIKLDFFTNHKKTSIVLLIFSVIGSILLILAILSLSVFSLKAQFDVIKNDIEKTGYDICEIRLDENKIIIDLNQIFEGSEPEKRIISKIPTYFDYEIVYHEGYSDYFINTITGHECDSEYILLNLNNIDEYIQKDKNILVLEKNDTFTKLAFIDPDYPTHDESLSIKFSPLYFENVDFSFDWCTQNNGFWNKDDSTCYFETQKDLETGMVAVNDMMSKNLEN